MKHTPGPWSVYDKHGGNHVVKGHKGNDALYGTPFICESVSAAHRTPEEDLANMKLIAASPEMFDLLTDIVKLADEKKIKAAKIEEIRGLLTSLQ